MHFQINFTEYKMRIYNSFGEQKSRHEALKYACGDRIVSGFLLNSSVLVNITSSTPGK
jgi:hypothetical protein